MASDTRPRQVPIAVVGLAAFVPGSTDPPGFWRNVLTGRDLMTDVPPSRWLISDYYDPDQRAPDKTYGRRGAFLPQVDFDPVRYGIPPNSLPAIDTTQLLALMVADRVIADCAVALPGDRERVSVLLGVAPLQMVVEAASRLDRPVWRKALLEHGIAAPEAEEICDAIAGHFVPWQEETFPGLLSNVVSGRIANKFDLHGVNHTTDAACASSLAALYSAVGELSLERSDLVITGGVDTANDILMYKCFSSTPALSPTGDCRPFSAAADGTMLGEGAVMFALKRLADAERDGDHVHAVIRGVGASSDGRGAAIYAPLPAGQVRALRRAYEQAGYGPETVELVEAHGTGTTAGDAAEFTALREVFDGTGREDRQWCALGSVKSQVGHTKAAAGAVGMLKAVLALQQKILPPTIKVGEPNPALGLDASPFYLAAAPRPWIRPAGEAAHPRRASVSSFGFGGTNFHVALEEYMPKATSAATPARHLHAAPAELILLSAPSPGALLEKARRVDLDQPLLALARQAAADFDPGQDARLAIVAVDADDLAAKLSAAAERIKAGRFEAGSPLGQVHYGAGRPAPGLTAFLFPGQGAQYVGMGGDLAMHQPMARAAWDAAARHEAGDRPLHRVVFPPPAFDAGTRAAQQALLTATEWAQPALAVHSMALLAVLTSLGLRPVCVAGHSFGELVALHAAGAFDAGTLLRLARRRGELMRDAAAVPGAMLAATVGRDRAEAAIAGLPDVWLANDNGPAQVVFSGTRQALETVEAKLAADGIGCVRLQAATGFHSPLVAPAAGPFAEFLDRADIRSPVLAVYAGRDAGAYPADPAAVRTGLADQIAAPVRFVDVIEAMYDRGVRTFVEVGAGSTLSGLTGQILGEREHEAVSLDRKGCHGLTSLLEGLGRLAVRGLAFDLAPLYAPDTEQPAGKLSKATVRIDGGNYGRPYPPTPTSPAPAVNGHASPIPDPAPGPARNGHPVLAPAPGPGPGQNGHPAPASTPRPGPGQNGHPAPAVQPIPPPSPQAWPADDGRPAAPAGASPRAVPGAGGDWLRVLAAAQEQAAAAHADFQRALSESHLAYLRMAEATFAHLLTAATGEPLPVSQRVPAPQIPSQQVLAQHPPAYQEPPPPGTVQPPPEAVPVPAPPVGVSAETPATSAPQGNWDAESVSALLLEVVAERTGYPPEMLSVDMEIDTELGIDSIKKVEILSAVRERIGHAPEDLAAIATLRTLRAIAEQYAQPMAPPSAPATTNGNLTRPAADPSSTRDVPIARWSVRAVPAPASGLAMPGLTAGQLAVTDDGTGVAPELVARLARHGIRAEVVAEPAPDASGLIALDGLRRIAAPAEAASAQRLLFLAARKVASRMTAEGGVFVTVQDTGGDFGLSGYGSGTDPVRAWLGGPAALARTAAKEWPRAAVKAIDCAIAGRTPAGIADALVTELLTGSGTLDVGLRADGTRVTLALEPVPAGVGTSTVGPQSVIVATGGARGVTAAGLRLLASQHRPRLALLGRTPLDGEPAGLSAATSRPELIRLLASRESGTPAEIAAAADRVLAVREIRETLRAIEQCGAPVRYYAVDVTDPEALARVLAAVRAEWGPVTAVVHGAGVIADALIADKAGEQFDRVFTTKVAGLQGLLAATADDPLAFFCAFSSVAAQFGNPGQCDYAMANEVLNQVLSAEQARRPGCVVRSIGWGPWQGGMVTDEIASRFHDAGLALIDPEAGAAAFAAELSRPAASPRVIVSAGAGSPDTGLGVAAGPAAVAGQVTVGGPDYAYLLDHQVGDAPVAAVATVLDWFVGAARAWRPADSSLAIRDLRVLKKLLLPRLADGGHRLTVRGQQAPADQGGALEIDLLGENGQRHYRASVPATAPPAAGAWNAPAGLMPLPSPYDGVTLFHGPRLQVIRPVPEVGSGGAAGTVAGSGAHGWDRRSWQLDPAAVDGALQLAVLWAWHAGTGRTLPMAIRECRVHRPGASGDQFRCVVLARRTADSEATCDVALLGPDDGAPWVELLGVELVRRPDSG
jgi:acyl transferase domain-containing protein/NADP-dependent 3-hydroxy acid dehydrogenase YdfG